MAAAGRILSLTALSLILGLTAWAPVWAGPLEDLEKGRKALAEGRPAEAQELLQEAIWSGGLPNFRLAEAHFLLGRIFERRGWFGDAERHYSWAVTFDRGQGVYLDSLKRMREVMRPGGP